MIFEFDSPLGPSLYFLFEHKSGADKKIENQIIKYMDTFELDYFNDHENTKLPLKIIPVVIYQGLSKWNPDIKNGRLADLQFFDICRIPDEHIRGTAILRIVLLTLKYIRSKELVTKIDQILEIFKELEGDADILDYIESFTYYVEHAARLELREMLTKKIDKVFNDEKWKKSTVIKNIEKRGEERGLEKGIDIGLKAASRILNSKKSDTEIAEETGLSVDKIRGLREKLKNM